MTSVEGLTWLPNYAGQEILEATLSILAVAPARHMVTPGGKPMSVAMSNCGPLGWISDRRGYRYAAFDPLTGAPWPKMPDAFAALARGAALKAGFANFDPDACLINVYAAGSRMSLHQDRDEADFTQPIVSVSLGASALFRIGGSSRRDSTRSVTLRHGDVLVMGGAARLAYHGIDRLMESMGSPLGDRRINLTFRRAQA